LIPGVQLLAAQALSEEGDLQASLFASEKYIVALTNYPVHVLSHAGPLRIFKETNNRVCAGAIVESVIFIGHMDGLLVYDICNDIYLCN
jgi:hypothetical protein